MASAELPAIEADSLHIDSDYGTSIASDTTSLTESVINYVHENGRRYHRLSEGRYVMPNDEQEQDRLDLHHHGFLVMLGGKSFLAPVTEPHRILDCGTGTGIWAIDVADEFPQAEVIGIDLSPIQPVWVAPNTRFQVDDLEQDWTFEENHFDFIHSRILNVSIRDWPRYIEHMFKHSAPGGYVELVEGDFRLHSDDGTVTPDTAAYKYIRLLGESGEKAGLRMMYKAQDYERLLKEAGFVDVVSETFKQPWGMWPRSRTLKEIGKVTALQAEDGGLEAFGLALMTRFGGMSKEEVIELCEATKNEILGRKVHGYTQIYVTYGRKPL